MMSSRGEVVPSGQASSGDKSLHRATRHPCTLTNGWFGAAAAAAATATGRHLGIGQAHDTASQPACRRGEPLHYPCLGGVGPKVVGPKLSKVFIQSIPTCPNQKPNQPDHPPPPARESPSHGAASQPSPPASPTMAILVFHRVLGWPILAQLISATANGSRISPTPSIRCPSCKWLGTHNLAKQAIRTLLAPPANGSCAGHTRWPTWTDEGRRCMGGLGHGHGPRDGWVGMGAHGGAGPRARSKCVPACVCKDKAQAQSPAPSPAPRACPRSPAGQAAAARAPPWLAGAPSSSCSRWRSSRWACPL